VQVSRVDLDGRRIDFRLVREGEDLLLRAAKDKGAAREPSARLLRDDSVMESALPAASRKGAARPARTRKGGDSERKGAPGKAAASKRGNKIRR